MVVNNCSFTPCPSHFPTGSMGSAQDLDPEELGGNVSWLPPNLTERVPQRQAARGQQGHSTRYPWCSATKRYRWRSQVAVFLLGVISVFLLESSTHWDEMLF
jgi:hypothetical protein